MVGIINLYKFVSMLGQDWNAVINEVSINYGNDKPKDIGATLGITKKRKRSRETTVNDGRPPDTTDELVNGRKKKHAKLGQQQNFSKLNKNMWSADLSYQGVTENAKNRNCCWISAGLESLYALFSPLCIRGISGQGKNLFTCVPQHFSS